MPKYLNTKDGSLESAVLEAVSPAQQAAIAISKKKKAGKPGYDDEGKSLKDDMTAEDKEAYEKFFKSALKKFGVDSPADFKSDEEKKKFFDYIDKNYKGENEETDLEEKEMRVFRVSSSKLQGNVHAKDEKEAEKIFRKKGAKGKITITDRGPVSKQIRRNVRNEFEPVVEETLAMKAARHISDMWTEASGKKEVEEKDKKEEKDEKKTMTGKPVSKVDVTPTTDEEEE